jgi:hypothetical protein
MNNEQFYAECAALLGTTYDCTSFPYKYRTRWNNRAAGSGRFPGHGTIRVFGDIVHATLHHPKLTFTGSKEELLAQLGSCVTLSE